ncbi:hypothetical protein EYF80_029644 [Liparis tanakae]|uniref:Uncharacterized protein n=1 Tax=Liparis tanakae TaxID=230148 RepID=A0A4Z2H590_9TELE|nr:hypothetical protein EYF80_029644 [Liparis tanakae]
MLQARRRAAHQRVQGLGQRMQRVVGRGGRGGDDRVGGGAALDGRAASIDVPHQLLHLVQGAGQHEDVVASQHQGGDLGQLADGRALSVGHDLPQAVHRLVQVVHPLPFAAVDFQPQVLPLVLVGVRPALGLAAPAAALRPALAGLVVRSVFMAVSLENLVGEEAPGGVVHHQVRGRGAAATGAGVGVHLVGSGIMRRHRWSKDTTLSAGSHQMYDAFEALFKYGIHETPWGKRRRATQRDTGIAATEGRMLCRAAGRGESRGGCRPREEMLIMAGIKGVQAFSSGAEWGSACHVSIHEGAGGDATVCGWYMMLSSFVCGSVLRYLPLTPGVTAHKNLSVGGHWLSSLARD